MAASTIMIGTLISAACTFWWMDQGQLDNVSAARLARQIDPTDPFCGYTAMAIFCAF